MNSDFVPKPRHNMCTYTIQLSNGRIQNILFFINLTDNDDVRFKNNNVYFIFVQCLIVNGKRLFLGKIVMAGGYHYKDAHSLLFKSNSVHVNDSVDFFLSRSLFF